MIKSSTVTLKFANAEKKRQLKSFVNEYRNVLAFFIDELWNAPKVTQLIPKSITSKAQTWLTARAVQCAAKQASAIVRGTKRKNGQRRWRCEKLLAEGKVAKAQKLQSIIDKHEESKPNVGTICPELDSRFVQFDLHNATTFDGWLTLGSLGNKLKLKLPFKRHKHFNGLMKRGALKQGVRLLDREASFAFDLPDVPKRKGGSTLGVDIGSRRVFATSAGQLSKTCKHGHTLATIQAKLARKRKGGVGFRKTQTHRTNHINWSLNQLNTNDVQTLICEDIKHLRKNKVTNRHNTHWTYADIFGKLESLCEERGVLVQRTAPAFTSQRCSQCAWVHEDNRDDVHFQCTACGHTADADLNAAINIALQLPKLKRASQRTGFHWGAENGEQHVVPHARKETKSRRTRSS